MSNVIGKLIGVILCCFMLLIMHCNVMISDQVLARRSIVAEVTNFLDEVTDTGTLDKKQLSDLYLACSAYGPIVDVKVTRMKKVVNPDPKKPGSTYVTYVGSEDIYNWDQGDVVKVRVEEVGPTGTASFVYSVVGLSLAPVEFSLAGRVR